MKRRVPKFKNEEEERDFWSKNDSSKYLNWKSAEPKSFPSLTPSVEAATFNKVLDKHTVRLSKEIQKLDHRLAYWGSARKALNLFLGDTAYHAILRNEYRLDRIEKFSEVPLDSQVANGLISLVEERNVNLPKWKTIRGLLPNESNLYQSFASSYAKELGCTRIQLDLLLWLRNG